MLDNKFFNTLELELPQLINILFCFVSVKVL